MDLILTLIAVSIFAVIMLAMLGVYYQIEYRQGHWRLVKRMKEQIEQEIKKEETHASVIKIRLIGMVTSLGNHLKPKSEGELSHLRKTFLTAGYREEKTPIFFFGIKIISAILLPFILFLLRLWVLKTMVSLHWMVLSLILAFIGFYLPNLWLHIRIRTRQEKIIEGFPDALDLMVVCVEAGIGLDAAITRVGEEMKLGNKVLSEEFRLLSFELRAGKTRRDALKNFALRTDVEDINSFVTLLIQTEKFGTGIAQALRVYSDSMRTKRYQRAEEMAAKLPVKLVFPLILFIFPALFVTILGPAFIRIVRIFLPALEGG
jgi:tight adherence protein C